MNCCAGGGIILSWVAIRYQLGLVFHAGSLIAPLSASTPQGTCERSEEHTSELQSLTNLVCRLLLEKKKIYKRPSETIYDTAFHAPPATPRNGCPRRVRPTCVTNTT